MCIFAECASTVSVPAAAIVSATSKLAINIYNNNTQSYDITFNSHTPNVSQTLANNSLVSDGELQSAQVPLEWGMMGLTLIIACSTVGNLLVCLAVCWERRLQNMTNYFLMSLAIADLLVSLLVMPLGMIVEIFGHFPMNPEVCVLWVASDVLMCSASIWHMCTMSMDRYFTLKYPMRYGRNKTRRMVAGKILFVWVVSVAISSPVCIHGFIDTSSVYRNGDCVPKVKNFVIYGSVFAFYIPLLIMIVTYVLTIRILWKNQQRMKHIERSHLKPRLAQVTAQCTGFAFPKLLTSLRKTSRSTSSSRVMLSRARARRRPMGLGSAAAVSSHFDGNDNPASDAHFSEDNVRGQRDHLGMVYLAPPTPQTLTPGSSSPCSARVPLNSDTDESESEATYFTLLQTSQSCRSLNTPGSVSASEKSLHVRLQKKQLHQQQQQELHLLRQEYHHQRRLHNTNDVTTLLHSPSLMSKELFFGEQDCSFSAPTTPSSSLSPLFDNETQQQHTLPDNSNINDNSNNNPSPVLSLKSVSVTRKHSRKSPSPETGNKPSKKKRYSKRCKKRRNSLTQESSHTDHLEVPCPVYLRRSRTNKQHGGTTALTNAVSDTQVSQAGRGSKSDGQCDQGVSSFHLSYNNLSKDYKSLEWDRRYFQIQEEMDRCLKGEFGLWDRRHSKQEQISENLLNPDKLVEKEQDQQKTIFAKPEILVPVSDPLSVHFNNVCNVYSHSAPNSPLNRRTQSPLTTNLNSDEEEEYELDNEEHSDKTNDEEDNDTTGSSNSDTVTIRLHPPTPKVKGTSAEKSSFNSNSCEKLATDKSQNVISLSVPSQTSTRTEHMNELLNFRSSSSSSTCSNKHNSSLLANGTSVQSVSLASTSPVPEFVISSEGELTLEETDDTMEDGPKEQRVKLRRPNQLQSHYRFSRTPSPSNQYYDPYSKSKRSSFRNTFRMHRGKESVTHILSLKTASNERKASKVLGIIFVVFVILWTPFFTVNIVNAACETCVGNFNKEMMSLFLWMGYIASLANPIIYTMFNTAFRRTFIKILTCKIRRSFRSTTSELHYMSYTTMLASERRNTVTVMLRDESR